MEERDVKVDASTQVPKATVTPRGEEVENVGLQRNKGDKPGHWYHDWERKTGLRVIMCIKESEDREQVSGGPRTKCAGLRIE